MLSKLQRKEVNEMKFCIVYVYKRVFRNCTHVWKVGWVTEGTVYFAMTTSSFVARTTISHVTQSLKCIS